MRRAREGKSRLAGTRAPSPAGNLLRRGKGAMHPPHADGSNHPLLPRRPQQEQRAKAARVRATSPMTPLPRAQCRQWVPGETPSALTEGCSNVSARRGGGTGRCPGRVRTSTARGTTSGKGLLNFGCILWIFSPPIHGRNSSIPLYIARSLASLMVPRRSSTASESTSLSKFFKISSRN